MSAGHWPKHSSGPLKASSGPRMVDTGLAKYAANLHALPEEEVVKMRSRRRSGLEFDAATEFPMFTVKNGRLSGNGDPEVPRRNAESGWSFNF